MKENVLSNILFIILMLYSSSLKSQNTAHNNCNEDSIVLIKINLLFKDNKFENISKGYVNYKIIAYERNTRANFCTLLLYAKFFDCYLDRGLDLQFEYKQRPYTILSTNDPDVIEQYRISNEKNIIFDSFSEVYNSYKQFITSKYINLQNLELNKDIENLSRYNISCNPTVLKSILFLKYNSLISDN